MASDQQFCLRWNNHQSTLVSVFDNLLESQTLVDCTLAADGQYLKAHKVVLSACSPYLEAILCQNLDKHPILILKDVKFSELKAMLDYMYRGEVNISQEQLSTFLKAAESLQIKGLTDSGGGGSNDRDREPLKRQDLRKPLNQPVPHIPQPRPVVPHPGLMERRSLPHFPPHIADMQPQSPRHAREGSTSPTARKRRRPNRPSSDDSNFISTPNSLSENQPDTSDSCDVPVKQAASSTPNVPNTTTKAPETDSNRTTPQPQNNQQNSEQKQQVTVKKEFSEALLTPKTEFDYGNDNSMEDVTYEDDEEEEVDLSKPGTSFAANSQGFPPWQMGGDGSNDDSNNMYSPDVTAATNQNNSQGLQFECQGCDAVLASCRNLKIHFQFYCVSGPRSGEVQDPDATRACFNCSKSFKTDKVLRRHLTKDCGMLMRFKCQICYYTCHWHLDFLRHMFTNHSDLMEVLEMVKRAEIKGNELVIGNLDNMMDVGNEEVQVVTGNEEDEAEVENEEQLLESRNKEDEIEAENEEQTLESRNEEDEIEADNFKSQLVSENDKNLLELETFIDLTQIEDKEIENHRVSTEKLLEKVTTEHHMEIETENEEFKLKRVNKKYRSEKKSKKEKQNKTTFSKSILPLFESKPVNYGTSVSKMNTVDSGRVDQESGYRKKIKTNNSKRTDNNKCYQEKGFELGKGETNFERLNESDNDKTEAVVPMFDLNLDQFLEELPKMSEEEFEKLKTTDPIFQF